MAEQKQQNFVPHQNQNTNGVIEWKVNGNLLQQFKDATHNQQFQSPPFETMDGTTWRVLFYPHGKPTPDECSIHLQCVKLNDKKKQIGVNYSFNIIELDWCHDTGSTFKHDGHSWRASNPDNALKAQSINDLEVMTIKCIVEETMDVCHGNTYFEWEINNRWMQKWKTAKHKNIFYSPMFNAAGAEWQLILCPNGWDTEGTARLEIRCQSIESDKEKINVCQFIEIEALNHCEIHFNGNTVKTHGQFKCKSPFKWKDIQNRSEITICIKMWEKGSLPRKTAPLMSNLYSEKMMKLQTKFSEIIGILLRENKTLKKEIETSIVTFETLLKDSESGSTKYDPSANNRKENQNVNKKCHTSHKKRMELQTQWTNALGEINDTIDAENVGSLFDIIKQQMALCKEETASKQQQQIVQLQEEIKNLKSENQRIRATKAQVIEVNGIAMKEVETFDAAQDSRTLHSFINSNEYDEKMQIHEKKLNELKRLWLSSSSILIQKTLENATKETTPHLLLDRYMECKTSFDSQQFRIKNATMHCTKWREMKQKLNEERMRCDEMTSKIAKERQDLNTEYQTLHAKRMALQTQWKNALNEINQTIDAENKMNKAQRGAGNRCNISEMEAKQWKKLCTRCDELTQKYRDIESENTHNIQTTNKKFDLLWNVPMQRWFEWQPKDIIDWIKYLNVRKQLALSNEFDFDHVLNEMIRSKMNGLLLPNMDKTDLKTVGVMALGDRRQIDRKFQELISKYPRACDIDHTMSAKSTAKEVADWVVTLGPAYKQYMDRFIADAIDGCLMHELDEESLGEIVTNKIHIKKIMRQWAKESVPYGKEDDDAQMLIGQGNTDTGTPNGNENTRKRTLEQVEDIVHETAKEPPKKKMKLESNNNDWKPTKK
eukprot:580948_1